MSSDVLRDVLHKGIKREVIDLEEHQIETPSHRVKLDQSESSFDIEPQIKEEVLEAVASANWARYPEVHAETVTADLARHIDWHPEGVLLGNGSSELLLETLTATAWRGRHVIIAEPCRPLYRILIAALGGAVSELLMTDSLEFPLEAIRNLAANSEDHLILLASPSSPTGAALSPDEVAVLCQAAPSLVILDNAYGEFCSYNYLPLLKTLPNLIVLRSFSRAWSLAGVRAGYLVAEPELVRQIAKVALPYNVSIFTQQAVRVCLKYASVFRSNVETVVEGRELLRVRLAEIPGVRAYPSEANFVLVRFADARSPAAKVFSGLLQAGILVRDVHGYPLLDGCLRLGVGTRAENELLVATIGRLLRE